MTHPRRSPGRPLHAGEAWRAFTDADGTLWEVRELRTPDYDRRASTSLIFESVGAIRRVRNFPARWMELSDAELAELSNGR
jgi:hypothetical protein